MPKQVAPKSPDIFCPEGKPLGALVVKDQEKYEAAAVANKGRHGFSGSRVNEATVHIICGLEHLTGTHKLDLQSAYKSVARAVKERHNLTAPLVHAAFTTAAEHWTRGNDLADVMLGRSPS